MTNEPVDADANTDTDAQRFRKTLIKVMAMQLVALQLLWWLQKTFTT